MPVSKKDPALLAQIAAVLLTTEMNRGGSRIASYIASGDGSVTSDLSVGKIGRAIEAADAIIEQAINYARA